MRPGAEQTIESQPYLAVTGEVNSSVEAAVDGAFTELFAWLGDRDITPSGPRFTRVLDIDRNGEPLAVEACVPVAVEVFADNGVHFGVLPYPID